MYGFRTYLLNLWIVNSKSDFFIIVVSRCSLNRFQFSVDSANSQLQFLKYVAQQLFWIVGNLFSSLKIGFRTMVYCLPTFKILWDFSVHVLTFFKIIFMNAGLFLGIILLILFLIECREIPLDDSLFEAFSNSGFKHGSVCMPIDNFIVQPCF